MRRLVLSLAFALCTLLALPALPATADASGGAVFSWGLGGRLGNGASTDAPEPVPVTMTGALAGKTVTQVASGGSSSCALTSEGTVFCWGSNGSGQLGDGTNTSALEPVAVKTTGALAGRTVTQIWVGNNSACALTGTNGVLCWGDNFWGQLGTGDNVPVNEPTPIVTSGALAGQTVTTFSTGGFWSPCVVLATGGAACWGAGNRGTLGNGTAGNQTVPTAVDMSGVLSGARITQMASGALHTCALTSAGVMACWGLNTSGQLGTGAAGSDALSPVLVSTGSALNGQVVAQAAAGYNSSCAVTQAGAAACWGDNAAGQVGDGSNTSPIVTPTLVSTAGALAGEAVSRVSMGVDFACALAASRSLFCWGTGFNGQLGDGSSGYSYSPVPVVMSGALAGWTVVSLSTGDNAATVLAVRSSSGGVPPVMQQFGVPVSGSCNEAQPSGLNWAGVPSGGWSRTWAEWINGGTGGAVCTRSLVYSSARAAWILG